GLTNDERYLVAMRFDVATDALPAEPTGQFGLPMGTDIDTWRESGFRDYIFNTTLMLNALAPSDFEPSLDTYDTLIRSLYVIPGWEDVNVD
ncbi:MAG: hypothetical protein AAF125_12405, partial [Chloroflexota bacterium]